MVPPQEPEGIEHILQEAAGLYSFVQKNRLAGDFLVGVYKTIKNAYSEIISSNNKRIINYLENHKELVDRAETSLKEVQRVLVEMKMIKPEKIEHLEVAEKNYDGILNGAASCQVMTDQANKLYKELTQRKDLKEYLFKYKRSIGEQVANFVRPYLKYEEGFREVMKDIEFVKLNMDKVRKALAGLEFLRRAIKALLDLGVEPTGYNVKQLQAIVRKELPSAA